MAACRYRLVVFDWDGTLVDSIGSIVSCTRAALADAGVEPPGDDLIRGLVGLGLNDTFDRFYPGTDGATRDRILDRYRHHWVTHWHARHDAFPRAEETLVALAGTGTLLAVATAKSRRGLVRDFERTGLGRFFHASRTVDECPPKPAPTMLFELMEELGVRQSETLMVGDSRWDLEMARNAGVDAVGLLGGAHPHEDLVECGPRVCLPGVAGLLEWLAADAAAQRAAIPPG